MQIAFAALYCHLWPVWLYHIFPQSQKGKIVGEKLFNIKGAKFYNKFISSLYMFRAHALIVRAKIFALLTMSACARNM